MCNPALCRDADGDWTNGCEAAQIYTVVGLPPIDCSRDVDLTHVDTTQPPRCDGNIMSATAGRCLFTCQPGWADCDDSPLNGCETNLEGACGGSCVYQSSVSCGKDKCIDCTRLPGTLSHEYANPRAALVSASMCLPDDATLDGRATDFHCDTSPHYLDPRYDPPDGTNGACQVELCRDLDGDWTNGCESAQLYGRGRRYNYGNQNLTDARGRPYIPDPYESRFQEYRRQFLADPVIRADIPRVSVNDYWAGTNGYEAYTLNYASEADFPAEVAIIGTPYEEPVDCELSEWSEWGLCTWQHDCQTSDSWLQTRIRTRQILRQVLSSPP